MTTSFECVGFDGDASSINIQPGSFIGIKYNRDCRKVRFEGAALIRANSVLYADVSIGENFQCGHGVLIRENTRIGKHVVVGTNTVIDGNVAIGDFVKIESNCYIPTHVEIGDRVFIGPNVVMTNDAFPLKLRDEYVPQGPIIEDLVTIGGAVTIVPGVRIGKGSFIAAGSVVTKDIPADSFVRGVPGRCFALPERLRGNNLAISWMPYITE